MLPESRLFNFIDSEQAFTLSFLEGQKLIHDLAVIHDLKNKGFHFFRNCILSSVPLINFLKPQENMGFFVDSDNPYFRLKVEMNYTGQMRTLLLPEVFDELPTKFTGKVRQSKMFPHSPRPYMTIMGVENQGIDEVVNSILKDSYQVNSMVILSENSDQAVLFSMLPKKNVNKEDVVQKDSLQMYWDKIKAPVLEVMNKSLTDKEEIKVEIERTGFSFLQDKEVVFKCNCSRDRMVTGIAGLTKNESIDSVFEGKSSLEAKCDYCKTNYLITKDEIAGLTKLQ